MDTVRVFTTLPIDSRLKFSGFFAKKVQQPGDPPRRGQLQDDDEPHGLLREDATLEVDEGAPVRERLRVVVGNALLVGHQREKVIRLAFPDGLE